MKRRNPNGAAHAAWAEYIYITLHFILTFPGMFLEMVKDAITLSATVRNYGKGL